MKKSEKKQNNQVEDSLGNGVEMEPKEVTALDIIKENKDEDKLYAVENQEQFEEEGIRVIGIPTIVFTNNDKKSNVMLKELKLKSHIDIQEITDEKDILKKLREEKEQGNVYAIAYLPYTNDDCNNENSKLLNEIANMNNVVRSTLELQTTVYPYFADREDAEVNSQEE